MQGRKLVPSLVVVSVACGVLVLAQSLFPQVATVKGKGKLLELVELAAELPVTVDDHSALEAGSESAYVVPDGRILVITDVVISNLQPGNTAYFKLLDRTSRIVLPLSGSVVMNFSTGIEYGPGETIDIDTDDGGVTYSMRGYLRKE